MVGHLDDDGYLGLPHDHPYWSKIGRVSVKWNFFERLIDQLIWDLAGLDPNAGGCITAQLISPRPRLHAALALCRLRGVSKSLVDRLNKFKERHESVYDKRNRAVHDIWVIGNRSGVSGRLELSARSTLVQQFKPITVAELDETVLEIERLSLEFQETANEIVTELLAGRAKSSGA